MTLPVLTAAAERRKQSDRLTHQLRVAVRLAELKAKAEKPAAAVALTVALASQIEALANDLAEESISEDEFVSQARAALLAAGADAAELAKLDDGAFVESLIDGRMEYLGNFASDVSGGISLGEIASRSLLWGGVAWSIYQSARGEVAKQDGLTQANWTLEDEVEHCEGCLDLADGSPYAIEDLPSEPGDGSTPCLSNCRCSVDYS